MLGQIFQLQGLGHETLFSRFDYPWEWIKALEEYLYGSLKARNTNAVHTEAKLICASGPIYVGREVTIRSGAVIYGPAYIGDGSVIGHNALLREGCLLMGKNVVGHCSEVKRSILFPGAHLAHRNYVGDSVVGRDVNFGNGSCVANLLGDGSKRKTIHVTWEPDSLGCVRYDTGLRKFGALVGDRSRIGCNAVLNPATILGHDSLVLSGVSVIGTHEPWTEFRPAFPEATPRKH